VRYLTGEQQEFALRFADVALPPDATDCEPWQWHAGAWRRFFLTREWNIAGIWVSVAGEQTHDGDVRRWMHVGGEDECRTSDRHALIAALEEAGKLLDSLLEIERPSCSSSPLSVRRARRAR
jgi:hypothetical protein